jgi:hypothetical protein
LLGISPPAATRAAYPGDAIDAPDNFELVVEQNPCKQERTLYRDESFRNFLQPSRPNQIDFSHPCPKSASGLISSTSKVSAA